MRSVCFDVELVVLLGVLSIMFSICVVVESCFPYTAWLVMVPYDLSKASIVATDTECVGRAMF